jgi:hypothetical protein
METKVKTKTIKKAEYEKRNKYPLRNQLAVGWNISTRKGVLVTSEPVKK